MEINVSSQRRERPMAQAAAILALSERLRKQACKARNPAIVADLRLATFYLRALAALKIAEEAGDETDPKRKLQLELESAQLNS
jgi:hypothetical protein